MTKIVNFHKYINNGKSLPLIIGFFDGFHMGHLKLFHALKKHHFNILTFTNTPSKMHTFIYDNNERITNLEQFEPSYILLMDLKKHNMQSMSFIYHLLQKTKPSVIIVGEDFKFGRNRHGSIQQLEKYFKVRTIKVENVYKTSNIKSLIKNGDVVKANKLLIKPYTITGKVIHGKKIGRKLGYPTANVKLELTHIYPLEGSYASYTIFNHHKYPSATFIRNGLLETHLFGFNKQIYNKNISIQLIKYHKPIQKFRTMSDLKKIIDEKINAIKNTF